MSSGDAFRSVSESNCLSTDVDCDNKVRLVTDVAESRHSAQRDIDKFEQTAFDFHFFDALFAYKSFKSGRRTL